MGAEVCRAVEAADGLELVAAVDVGDDRSPVEARRRGRSTSPTRTRCWATCAWCIEHGIHVVVGTTGFDDAKLDQVRDWLADRHGGSA